MVGGLPLAARGIAEDFGKTACREGAGWVCGQREVASPSPCKGTQPGSCGWGTGLVGLEMSAMALLGGQWPLASPRTCSSLPAAAALANIAALICPASSLLHPVKTATGPCVSLSSAVTLLAQSSTALGELGALGCPVGALPMLSRSGLRAAGSRVVGLGYFGVQPAPLNLPWGWGLLQ